MPRIQNGDHHINLQIEGHGEPVLLLHSSGMSGFQWAKLRNSLRHRYRVITPDLHGYGDSTPWPEHLPFSHDEDVEFLAGLMTTIDEPVHIVGHSYGAFVALQLALRRPGLVRSLALFDPVAFGVLYSSGHVKGMMDLDLAPGGTPGFFDTETGGDRDWMRSFIDYWNGAGAFDRMPADRQKAVMARARKTFWEVRELLLDRTPHSFYAHIAAPTLILTGSRTTGAARGIAEVLAGTIPHAQFHEFIGLGHMGPVTHADQVNPVIESFLGELDDIARVVNG